MSDTIEAHETPSWLLELEANRERRLKARLGHETGAGASCLKCADKCPGLDLHFWRKCCKVCKCSKEEHEVQDDDIYGWAQFQLLGSKPNKIKRKILLPGKNDELELDWAPKGNNETVDRYLKTLPPDQLLVKGSQAALERKQLLHKQIPIHDIDPELCHDLTDEELSKMNDYIAHVKQSSVGVGQIVSLSTIIQGNLHMLNPSEAALISCRFPKGIALSDVQLHVQDEAKGLVPDLQKMSLHSKIHDRMHSLRTNDIQLNHPSAQYSSDLKPRKNFDEENGMRSNVDPNTNNRYPRSPNFNHKSVPTQFVIEKDYGLASQSEQLHPIRADLSQSLNRTIPHIRKECSPELISQPQSIGMIHRRGSASAFLPYSECCAGSGNPHAGQRHRNEGVKQGQPVEQKVPVDAGCNSNRSEQKLHGNANVASDQLSVSHTQKEPGRPGIHYVTGKHVIQSETQMPIAIPKSIKDLAFSTYEQTNLDPNELINKNVNPICDYENPSDPYFANQNLIKEIVSKANARSFTLLTDRNVTAEDTGTKMGNIKSPKKLSNMIPSSSGIHEDCVYPSDVKIGPIQDIDVEYPEIEVAVRGTDDVYEDYSPDSIKEILNNIKLPDCRYCRKPFEENEFAVTIDRADVLFHAKCFKCAGCNQMLVDNMYFYHKETDNIYCGRDYAKVRGVPRCKACDELIFTKEYTLAENATFHLKHFCCIECDIPLANRQYTLEDGMPYCLPCFEQSKANKCSGCLNVIKPDEFGCSLNGTHFHATDECFACMVCKKPLMGKKLLLRNDRLYCSHECYGLPK